MDKNINMSTLGLISMLNELAEDSKHGFLPLSAYNGTQTAVVYDTDAEDKDRSDETTKVYPVVCDINFDGGQREVSYYGKDENGDATDEYMVCVEVMAEAPAEEYPHIFCSVYVRDHEIEAKLEDAATEPLYQRIHIENGQWMVR